MTMLTLYGSNISGNTYKVRLTASLLGIDYNYKHIDLLAGEHKSLDYLEINPLGQVPALIIENSSEKPIEQAEADQAVKAMDNPTVLLESNAIIYYLAKGSSLIPSDPIAHAKLLQWLFYEQAEVKNNIAVVRFIKRFQDMPFDRQAEYVDKFSRSQTILNHLNERFAEMPFILGDSVSIADISLYAYTHLAEEGGLDLSVYEHLQAWFARIESLPDFIPM